MILSRNNNISIDEGIEKLRSLSISEKIKNNNQNIEKSSDKMNRKSFQNNFNKNLLQNNVSNNIINSINNTYNNTNNNKYKRKRNYITLIKENNKNGMININSNINNNNINQKKDNINTKNIIKKNKLLNAEELCQELINANNQEELEKVLYSQLLLLEEKKKKVKNIEQMIKNITILDKDKYDLIKCLKVISRALDKKKLSQNQLNNSLKELDDEISKVYGSIKFHQVLGDCYIKEINKLKHV